MNTKVIVWMTLAILAPSVSRAATPHLLTPIKADSDAAVVIEWDSDPAGIYTVEYSVGLNNDWKVAAQGFPSQGATTRWTDRGNPDPTDFRLSSAQADASPRFYRIKEERLMDMTMPITASVTTPGLGASLSGEVLVQGTASAAQGIASVKLYVDGYDVGRVRGPSFSIPLETRLFANGTHRLSIVVEDIGAVESPEENNPLSSRQASYGVANVSVVFDNTLSDVHLRYEHFRPELGQVQKVFARWSTPREWRVDAASKDGSTVYRSFTGSGSRIRVDWDGNDELGVRPNPQIVGYFFYDLGPGVESPMVAGGGGGGLPQPGGASLMAGGEQEGGAELFPGTAQQAILAGLDTYFLKPPPMPPVKKNGQWLPWEDVFGSLPPFEIKVSEKQIEAVLSAVLQGLALAFGNGQESPQGPEADPVQVFSVFQPFSLLGTFAVLGQGHHPAFGSYPTPPRLISGNVRMSATPQFGPWGPLRRVKGIVSETAQEVAKMGYGVLYKKLDDQVTASDFIQSGGGSPNTLNQANLSLFVGHSVAARDAQSGFFYKQGYVPVYNSALNSMQFVGSSSMKFGSTQLKWMAFFSCNFSRSSLHRPDGIYDDQKSSFALPMNGRLHIMQAYATEMAVHPDFPVYWTLALKGSSLVDPTERTVIGAWNYACRRTQPAGTPTDPVNVARSIYWPECQGDYIFGYGPQTTPNRSPNDPSEQADLEEFDEPADAPEP